MVISEPAAVAAPPSTSPIEGPVWQGNHPIWSASTSTVEVRFVGRGLGGTRAAILRRVEGRELPVAQAKQVHSDRVLAAQEGDVGEGDALWTDRRDLALSVITADCVPLVLAPRDGGRIAAVHAGWRGIVAGIVPRTIEALETAPEELEAWIGPSIGVCCYEVGDEVAAAVADASSSLIVTTHGAERPHVDLVGAVRHQLDVAGVAMPRMVRRCTHCDPERLWSYRREGAGGGRNVTYVWRRG